MKTSLWIVLALFFSSSIFAGSPKVSMQQEPRLGVNIGNKAPEIIEKSVNGEIMKLSDLKGEMVLIDFWASWCSPCRRENPTVVRAYHEFKDKKFIEGKGFTVFSVSLDQNKDSWINAIKADKLEWPNHVSDLKKWQSKHRAVYRINGIPSNFLINGKGIIVAKNLRGPALRATLAKYVK